MTPTDLQARLLDIAADLPFEVTVRPMMGGYVGYANGRPFVSLSPGGFGIKLTPADQDRLLLRPGARRLRHAADQPPSKTYIAISDDDVADDQILAEWLELAATTAPPPRPRRR